MIDEEKLRRWADRARDAAMMTCAPYREPLIEAEAEMRAELEELRANHEAGERRQQAEQRG